MLEHFGERVAICPVVHEIDDSKVQRLQIVLQTVRLAQDVYKRQDLQLLVSLMWKAGAEAISINDNRLGVQTSIRTAGNSILIGTTPVSSPYRIQAIGNKNELANRMGQKELSTCLLYTSRCV